MPFNPQNNSPQVEAYRNGDTIRLTVSSSEYQIPLSTARTICDLLSITVYDESIVGLMAKRRRLTMENEQLKEKLQNVFQYYRRKHQKDNRWKKSH